MFANTISLSAHHPRFHREPAFPAEVVAVLRRELPTLTDEIIKETRRAVEEFRRPGHDPFRFGLEPVVEMALRQFLNRIADPAAGRNGGPDVFRELGRRECQEGRELDALQTAYRITARVTWVRIAEAGRRAHWSADTVSRLAEALFTHVEQITASSVEGHARARDDTTGTLRILRRRLLESVLSADRVMSGDALADLAKQAQWRLPETVACVAVAQWEPDGPRLEPGVGPDVLMDLTRPQPCLVVPHPDAPGRQDTLARALRGSLFAIGPRVPLSDAALSHRVAVQALSLVHCGVITCERFVRCSDVLSTLLLFHNEDMVRLMAERRYGPLAALKNLQEVRLSETLLAWLVAGGNARELAARLHVHPQTVRYRMRQLQDLFGDEMDDPDWKFEMGIVLRAKLLAGTFS
jgi:DNA-binding CsgD family transcriptional regulator